MRLIRGKVSDALGIENEVINFGNANVISGGNATGKTSWVDIIAKGLFNIDMRDSFVRIGADKAYIEIETDEGLKVERTVDTANKSTDLKVTRDGIPVRAPQTFLDQLFGVTKERKTTFAFNPVDFMLKSPKEQTNILLSMMPITVTQQDMLQWFGKVLPVNPNMHGLLVLKELEKYWYEARHEANGAVRATHAEVEALQSSLPDNYDVISWEDFSTMALSDEIRKGEQVNNYRNQGQELIDKLPDTLDSINNKFDLQVKEQEELLEFKIGKAKQGIETQKNEIKGEIFSLESEIQNHNNQIEELLRLIEENKSQIINLQNQIKLKEKDLDNFNNSILTTKVESLTNEMNISIKAIDENRNREILDAKDRVYKAETYIAENPEVEIKPLEEKYAEAESMKGFVEMAHNLQNVQERLLKETELAEKYDQFVQFCRNKPTELLKTMELPVEGLSIADDGSALFDGLTLKTLNTALQIRKCVDIAKSYAQGTLLKIIQVDRLESLDTDAKKDFYRQIRSNPEYQFIVTVVTNGKRCGDIIDVNYMSDEQFEKWLELVK